jgi:hypothetical protein
MEPETAPDTSVPGGLVVEKLAIPMEEEGVPDELPVKWKM